MGDGGKGDKRRPTFIDQKTLDENWERIFGKGKKKGEDICTAGLSSETGKQCEPYCTCGKVCNRKET